MRYLQIALIAIVLVCVVVATGITACNASYAADFAAGRAEGYKSGETAGFNRGEDDGYQKGYTAGSTTGKEAIYAQGKKDGYDQGQKEGYAEGYKTGNTEGDFAGYKRGYKEGFDLGRLSDVPNSYILKDPTSTEVSAFLANDNTNTRQYVLGIYDDRYFARDLCNSAEGHGLRSAYVTIVFTDNTTHEIVAFKINGSSITYYEPQTDNQVQPTINSLWEDNITKDMKRIKDILVAW
jgi:hypothetical protein